MKQRDIASLFSESLIGSLCKEIDDSNNRCYYLINAISSSTNKELLKRLNIELKGLNQRKSEILHTALQCKRLIKQNDLSILFLIEISKRSLALT